MPPPVKMIHMETIPLSAEQEKGKGQLVAAFPFDRLSTELALEIIRYATTPDFHPKYTLIDHIQLGDGNFIPRYQNINPYSTALSMCLVSHATRAAAMPQLLRTVALSETKNVYAFIRAIHIQRVYHQPSTDSPQLQNLQSRLAVDYTRYIKRMWVGTCWEDDPRHMDKGRYMDGSHSLEEEEEEEEWLDYRALWEVMRGVESLGIYCDGLHLLYNGLATDFDIADAMDMDFDVGPEPTIDSKSVAPEFMTTSAQKVTEWNCRRVTCVGNRWRWKPLTSTAEGTAFLARLTHLVMWIPETGYQPQPRLQARLHSSQTSMGARSSSSSATNLTPPWLARVPFNMMPNLMDLGFLPGTTPGVLSMIPTEMVVYHLPAISLRDNDSMLADLDAPDSDSHDPEQFRQWAAEDNTLASLDANASMDTIRKRHGLFVPLDLCVIQLPGLNTVSIDWEAAWLTGQNEYSWEMLVK